jgi:hypothetical protein
LTAELTATEDNLTAVEAEAQVLSEGDRGSS